MPLASRNKKVVVRAAPKKREGDSPKHLDFVRSLPCVVCGFVAIAHHLNRSVDGLPKGKGRKNTDRWAIPLCTLHHNGQKDSVHGHGDDEAWLAMRGIQARDLAAALWRVSGDLEAGERIVYRAKVRG
jgi:hypothetical protein